MQLLEYIFTVRHHQFSLFPSSAELALGRICEKHTEMASRRGASTVCIWPKRGQSLPCHLQAVDISMGTCYMIRMRMFGRSADLLEDQYRRPCWAIDFSTQGLAFCAHQYHPPVTPASPSNFPPMRQCSQTQLI